jgi:hypothetical protein
MASERIEEGFDVFVHDGDKAFGAVRHVSASGIVVYVEGAGDFSVPRNAIKDVYSEKVVLDFARLDARLKEAIDRAHKREDPTI